MRSCGLQVSHSTSGKSNWFFYFKLTWQFCPQHLHVQRLHKQKQGALCKCHTMLTATDTVILLLSNFYILRLLPSLHAYVMARSLTSTCLVSNICAITVAIVIKCVNFTTVKQNNSPTFTPATVAWLLLIQQKGDLLGYSLHRQKGKFTCSHDNSNDSATIWHVLPHSTNSGCEYIDRLIE